MLQIECFKILYATGLVLVTSLGYLIRVIYNHRRMINELRKQGVPMPKEWSWITGHLLVLQKYVDRIPPNAAVAFAMRDLSKEFANTEVFLMDFWPVYPPLFTVFGPEPASQVCNKYNLPKTAVASRFMKPIAGGPNLVSMNGDEWKYWRSLFNPGFSTGAMLNNVPHIVDSAMVFREKLVEKIILKVTLDYDSNYQRLPNVLATALRRISDWHSFWDPRVLMHPFRPFVQRYNGYVMNKYIRRELENRFREIKREGQQKDLVVGTNPIKSVITLALEAYLAQDHNTETSRKDRLDETFARYATYQIRLFLFAGTDTTASMMVYVYHMLSQHPDWLRRLRREHDEVFGLDPSNAARILKDNPSFLNNCRLTLAFIKETLRVYGPAGTMRSGLIGITVTDLQGNEQPMEYAGANVLHQALHLNPRIWARVDEFLPERCLVGPEHELHPDPAAYRPFEQGPRNCIGQTLVWNELRVAIILTCRDLKIKDAYDDFDAVKDSEMGMCQKLKRKVFGEPIRTLHGTGFIK